MPSPTFVDFANDPDGGGASVTTLTFDWGDISGLADNDVIIADIYRETEAVYNATPANWQQVDGFPRVQDTGGFKYQFDKWWRRRSGDSGTVSWTWTGAAWGEMRAVCMRNLITSEVPLIGTVVDIETAQNDEPVHPGLAVQRLNSGLIFSVWNFTGTTSTAAPAGFTEPNTGTGETKQYYDVTGIVKGATGVITGNLVDPEFAVSTLSELITEVISIPNTKFTNFIKRLFSRYRGNFNEINIKTWF